MNELQIYQLFQNILDKSAIIEGRFSIATGYGSSLNEEKVGEYITETLKPKRYPLVTLFPPIDFPGPKSSEYKMKMLFVLQQGNGTTGIKEALANNTSGHLLIFDWKDMRECALNFFSILQQGAAIPPRRFSVELGMCERFSSLGTAQLSGVAISFSMKVLDVQCAGDGSEYDIDFTTMGNILSIPEIHPQHKH